MYTKSLIQILMDLEENLVELIDFQHKYPEIDTKTAIRDYGIIQAAEDAGLIE